LLKPAGATASPIIPGELLTVRRVIALRGLRPPVLGPVLGLQLKVSVALPDRSTAAKEMVRGLVVHVTFGVVKLEEGRITLV